MSSSSDLHRVRRFFERGLYFLNQGQLADASVNLRDAMTILPSFMPARLYLAYTLASQKKYREALKILEDARQQYRLRADEKLEVVLLAASICMKRQDYQAALYYYDIARKTAPEDNEVRELTAICRCKSGNYDDALELFMRNAQGFVNE